MQKLTQAQLGAAGERRQSQRGEAARRLPGAEPPSLRQAGEAAETPLHPKYEDDNE